MLSPWPELDAAAREVLGDALAGATVAEAAKALGCPVNSLYDLLRDFPDLKSTAR